MYNWIFVAYYKFRLMFRNDLTDESKDKSDAEWSSLVVTLVQFMQVIAIWGALILMGRLPNNIIELKMIGVVLFIVSYLVNSFYFFSYQKSRSLIEKDKSLSPDKRELNTFLGIVIIILSVIAFGVIGNSVSKIPHGETYNQNKQ